jgi:thiosulfate reductase cytochrome b subunit
MSESKVYFYPLWLRIWHSLNGLSILLLIITGFLMHYGIHGPSLNFYIIVKIHNYTGVILALNYLVFFFGNIIYGNKRFYRLKLKGWLQRIIKQANYYAFGMFQGQQSPYPLSEKRKFNPLQKFSYFFSMYLVLPLVIVSGIALLYPELIVEEIYNVSGVFLTALFHAGLGFVILMFLIVHVYAASIGKNPLQNFKSILNGWHELNH